MNVTVAKTAGFCFGVKNAVEKVYETVEEAALSGRKVYTYGPVIHNESVVNELKERGAQIIEDLDSLCAVGDGIVILRSHGVGKNVYKRLEEKGVDYRDVTCPFVKKIHGIVSQYERDGYEIVICGDALHPEVQGICGWCSPENTAVIMDTEQAREFVPKSEKDDAKLCVVAQTTFNINKFKEIVDILNEKGYYVNVLNTICSATRERQEETCELALKSDAMIVIGSANSSNTRKLFEISRKGCENTYYIQTVQELNFSVLRNFKNVGITAGASTPNNIIEEVQTNVRNEF